MDEKLQELIEIAKQQNPRFIQRLNEDPKGIEFTDADGNKQRGSHLMSSSGNIVFPMIQEQSDGSLKYFSDWREALNAAKTSGNIITFPTEEDARLFGEQYKAGWPEFFRKFKVGGKINEPTTEIVLGSQKFKVAIAKTEEEKYRGLSEISELPKGTGMLFVYDEPQEDLWFTMEDTSVDLDIIFIDEEGAVTSVHPVQAHDPNPIQDTDGNAQFVLEVNIGSGVRVGDELDDFNDEIDYKADGGDFTEDEKDAIRKSKMLVLDSNGDVQMRLQGGERIVSMIKTRQLVKAAIKAFRSDSDKDYIKVGKLIFNELDAQDGRDPEYVNKPD